MALCRNRTFLKNKRNLSNLTGNKASSDPFGVFPSIKNTNESKVLRCYNNAISIKTTSKVTKGNIVKFQNGGYGMVYAFDFKNTFLLPFCNDLPFKNTAAYFTLIAPVISFKMSLFGNVISPFGHVLKRIADFERGESTDTGENLNKKSKEDPKSRTKSTKIEKIKLKHRVPEKSEKGKEETFFLKIMENCQYSVVNRIRCSKLIPFEGHLLNLFYPVEFGGSMVIDGPIKQKKQGILVKIIADTLRRNRSLLGSCENPEVEIEEKKIHVVCSLINKKPGYWKQIETVLKRLVSQEDLKHLIVVEANDQSSVGHRILSPFSAGRIATHLAETGHNVLLVADDLAAHGAIYSQIHSDILGENYQSNHYSNLFSRCGVINTPKGMGSVSAIAFASTDIVEVKNRVSYIPVEDIRRTTDTYLSFKDLKIDPSNILFNKFKRSIPKPYLYLVNTIGGYLANHEDLPFFYEIQKKVEIDPSAFSKEFLKTKLKRQDKLLKLLEIRNPPNKTIDSFKKGELPLNTESEVPSSVKPKSQSRKISPLIQNSIDTLTATERFFVLSAFTHLDVLDGVAKEFVKRAEEELVAFLRATKNDSTDHNKAILERFGKDESIFDSFFHSFSSKLSQKAETRGSSEKQENGITKGLLRFFGFGSNKSIRVEKEEKTTTAEKTGKNQEIQKKMFLRNFRRFYDKLEEKIENGEFLGSFAVIESSRFAAVVLENTKYLKGWGLKKIPVSATYRGQI